MTSRREQVLDAIKALVAAALPNAEVKRNLAKPERIAPGGLAIIRGGDPASPVTRAGKRSVEFAADQLFNEVTRPSTHRGLDRIEPVVEKINSHLGCRL